MVAVIHWMEDGQGSLLEEHLEFSPDELCVGHEMKEEKQWNNGLMSGLCKEARHMQISSILRSGSSNWKKIETGPDPTQKNWTTSFCLSESQGQSVVVVYTKKII
jgi:hypothetical protein